MEIRRNKVNIYQNYNVTYFLFLFFPFSAKCFNCMDELDVTYHCKYQFLS